MVIALARAGGTAVQEDQAVLSITWSGENGELPDPIIFDSSAEDVLRWATEAVRSGIPGITADPNVNLQDFVVERFRATDGLPARVMVRPKTPFGKR